MATTLRVAVVQMRSPVGRRAENLARSLAFIDEAAAGGANVVVLPELCDSGYALGSPEEARAQARPAETADSILAWAERARRHDLYVAAGFCELANGNVYNSAALIGPDGLIGVYRKAHLFYTEKVLFAPGDLPFPIFDTPVGRIGLLICYDLRFPEALRSLALRGVELICVPTAWVVLSGQRTDERGYCMQAYCAMAHASMNQVYIACADCLGSEGGFEYLGGSLICGLAGWPLAGPASLDREEILYADLSPALARTAKRRNPYNDTFADRRLDLYEAEGVRTR